MGSKCFAVSDRSAPPSERSLATAVHILAGRSVLIGWPVRQPQKLVTPELLGSELIRLGFGRLFGDGAVMLLKCLHRLRASAGRRRQLHVFCWITPCLQKGLRGHLIVMLLKGCLLIGDLPPLSRSWPIC